MKNYINIIGYIVVIVLTIIIVRNLGFAGSIDAENKIKALNSQIDSLQAHVDCGQLGLHIRSWSTSIGREVDAWLRWGRSQCRTGASCRQANGSRDARDFKGWAWFVGPGCSASQIAGACSMYQRFWPIAFGDQRLQPSLCGFMGQRSWYWRS